MSAATGVPETTLTRAQVEEQILAWFAKGLPSGEITFLDQRGHDPSDPYPVQLKMSNPNEVAVWAIAIGVSMEIGFGSICTEACRPRALPGWQLEVYCDAPVVPVSQRIWLRS